MRPSDPPRGIVFSDNSFLVIFEEWSVGERTLLNYKYHYKRPDGWFVRYDMEKEKRVGHPKYHLQSSVLDEKVRLTTGEVTCGEVLEMIAEQFIS